MDYNRIIDKLLEKEDWYQSRKVPKYFDSEFIQPNVSLRNFQVLESFFFKVQVPQGPREYHPPP